MDSDDQRLTERFQELRAETSGSGTVPDFAAMMAEAKRRAAEAPALEVVAGGVGSADVPARAASRHRGRWMRLGGWVSVAAAAALATVILVDRGPSGDEEFEQMVAAYTSEAGGAGWRSPTSGLLDVPGMDLTRSVPSIGGSLRGVDPSTLPPSQASPQEDNL